MVCLFRLELQVLESTRTREPGCASVLELKFKVEGLVRGIGLGLGVTDAPIRSVQETGSSRAERTKAPGSLSTWPPSPAFINPTGGGPQSAFNIGLLLWFRWQHNCPHRSWSQEFLLLLAIGILYLLLLLLSC